MRITEKDVPDRITEIKTTNAILIVLALAVYNEQAVIFKSIVPDPGWFDKDRTKFKDWWREI